MITTPEIIASNPHKSKLDGSKEITRIEINNNNISNEVATGLFLILTILRNLLFNLSV